MATHAALLNILDKMASKDKDIRYMALSDLQKELAKDSVAADDDTQRKLCRAVLQQLDETSGDISGLAVKCLGSLIGRISEANAEFVLTQLCASLVPGKTDTTADISSIALKTIVGEVTDGKLAALLVRSVSPKLMQSIASQGSFDVACKSLDILAELVSKFGGLMAPEHAQLRDLLLPLLADSRAGLRKRAIHTLAPLCAHMSDDLFDDTVAHVLSKLKDLKLKVDLACAYTQCIGSISRNAHYRFSKHLATAVPLVIRHYQRAGEGEEELREHSMQALEAFVGSAANKARAHVGTILPVALAALAHDPNYAAGDDAEDMEEEEADDEDELSEDFSDDEDMSWKVRRAAAKCLAALCSNCPGALEEIYPAALPVLLARFREREETVKQDVFHTFVELLRQIAAAQAHHGPSTASAPTAMLRKDVPAIIKASARQLKEKKENTRSGILTLLRELVIAVPNSWTEGDVAQLAPGIQAALLDKSNARSAVKIQALLFLQQALAKNPPQLFHRHLKTLGPALFACVGERYYKVAAEALRATEQLVYAMQPAGQAAVDPAVAALVTPLFQSILGQLSAQDQDQEVKECAMAAMAATLSRLGGALGGEVGCVAALLAERMRNDTTRLAAVRALTTVAQSPLRLDLAAQQAVLLRELTGFLSKANRLLRQAALAALQALAANQPKPASADMLTPAVSEAAALIVDTDLTLAAAALSFNCAVLAAQPAAAAAVRERALPQAIQLAQSNLLQGHALEALQAFFSSLQKAMPKQAGFNQLLDALLAAGHAPSTGRAAQQSIARCIAQLCTEAGDNKTASTVTALLDTLHSKSVGEGAVRLALLCLGEIGRVTDLRAFPTLKPALTEALQAGSEDIKSVASLALGGVAVGSLADYLPFLMEQIAGQADQPKDQYLLLRALNEVIVSLVALPDGASRLQPGQLAQLVQLLLGSCDTEAECQTVVAECLGHLALLNTQAVLPELHASLKAGSPGKRTVAVTAVKFMVVDRPTPADGPLHQVIGDFLAAMADPDRHVRKAAVQALSAASHNKVALVRDRLPSLLPLLYAQTAIDTSLIRTVDLGPFKHQIDDGLELRKAAFECMNVLLDSCRTGLDVGQFVAHLESGLKDQYDIKMPCHQMLAKLAALAPADVLAHLPRLVEPLDKTLKTKCRSDAVKQEVDRNEDLLRSCLRAVEALSRIPKVETCAPFKALMDNTVMVPPLAAKYAAVREESAEADGLDPMDLA